VGAGPCKVPASDLAVVAARNIPAGRAVRVPRLTSPAADRGSGALQGADAPADSSGVVVLGSLVASAEDCWLVALVPPVCSPVEPLWLSSL